MSAQESKSIEPRKDEIITEINERIEKNAPMRSSTEVVDSFEDRQEFAIDKGSTETMYQCIHDH
jgi:hypothetical protein